MNTTDPSPTTEVTITLRPHQGKAHTFSDTFAGWVERARDWWRGYPGDWSEAAQELGAPAYDEAETPDADDDSDEAIAWWDEQSAIVMDWLGTLDGVTRWAGYDKQPAIVKIAGE